MLSRFPNSTLKVGARVSLAPEHRWGRNFNNPLGVVGVVRRVPKAGMVSVSWDNGSSNSYNIEDYDLIAEGEPGFLATE